MANRTVRSVYEDAMLDASMDEIGFYINESGLSDSIIAGNKAYNKTNRERESVYDKTNEKNEKDYKDGKIDYSQFSKREMEIYSAHSKKEMGVYYDYSKTEMDAHRTYGREEMQAYREYNDATMKTHRAHKTANPQEFEEYSARVVEPAQQAARSKYDKDRVAEYQGYDQPRTTPTAEPGIMDMLRMLSPN